MLRSTSRHIALSCVPRHHSQSWSAVCGSGWNPAKKEGEGPSSPLTDRDRRFVAALANLLVLIASETLCDAEFNKDTSRCTEGRFSSATCVYTCSKATACTGGRHSDSQSSAGHEVRYVTLSDSREIIISRQGANDISGPSSTTTAPGPWDRARVCTHQSGLQLQLPPASTEKGPFRKRRQYQTEAKTGSASQIISANQLVGSLVCDPSP